MRKARPELALATSALALNLTLSPAVAQQPLAQKFPGYLDFQGRYLAVLSDADMVASAYMDGDLGPRGPEMRDELAIIPLRNGIPGEPRRIAVSNAVTAWPSLLALSGDGRFAYVAETDRPPATASTRREELEPSPTVRVVEIGGDLAGRVVQAVDTVGRAQGLSLRPQGDLLAVNVVNTPRPQIGFLPVEKDGRLGAFAAVDLPDMAIPPRDLAWSPDGELLAATFPDDNSTRFFRVNRDGAALQVTPVGDPVFTGKLPGVVQWSADGRHAFITNLHWGGGASDSYVGAQMSTFSAVRVDRETGQHRIVGAQAMGASAENFAISPDGRTIVTLNMENSFLTPSDPRLTYHSSLTLMTWHPEREQLVARGTFPFEGILPEGITFDGSGRYLAVANFAHSNPQRPIAETSVDFWRLTDGPDPTLVKMDISVPVMRGAHVVKIQP